MFEGEGGQVHHAGETVDDAALARRLVNEHAEQRMEDVLLVVRLAFRVKRTCNARNHYKLCSFIRRTNYLS